MALHKWYFLAVTKDGSNVRTYVNGNLENTCAYSGTDTNSNIWEIGRQNYGGDNYYFDGAIDDVRIYNRVLSASEVAQLYLLGD